MAKRVQRKAVVEDDSLTLADIQRQLTRLSRRVGQIDAEVQSWGSRLDALEVSMDTLELATSERLRRLETSQEEPKPTPDSVLKDIISRLETIERKCGILA